MSQTTRRRLSRRTRGIWIALLSTGLGLALLSVLALWLQAERETDLADPRANVTRVFKTSADVDLPAIRLEDVASAVGIEMLHQPGERTRALPEDTGSGLAWGDFDGDGDWDLYLVNMPSTALAEGQGRAAESANRLYRNDGGEFVDVTVSAGVADAGGVGMGASFADYDADGDADLYVTNRGKNRLYRNLGDGRFEDVAEQAGVADPLWSTGATWGDFDRDGQLDLYVCNYVKYDDAGMGAAQRTSQSGSIAGAYAVPFTLNPSGFDPQPNHLYRNLGEGRFEEIAAAAGVDNPRGRSLAASFVDLDGDGWLDLYVNNDVSSNRLFRNRLGELEDGRGPAFEDLSSLTGTADARGSMGLSVTELDGMLGEPDGLPDLFITHWIAQENAFYQSVRPNGQDLEYRDRIRQVRLGEISIDRVGWGSAVVDLDLDGRFDIAVANGSTQEHANDPSQLIAEPLFLFWNDGSRFHDVAPYAGEATAASHWARGLAAADFDGDGDIDLALAINRGRPLLLRNETQTENNSLRVRLLGMDAVRFGARVEVRVGGKRQTRWWGADVSYLSGHAPELLFGLGPDESAEHVSVRWADGSDSNVHDVPAGELEVVHGVASASEGRP